MRGAVVGALGVAALAGGAVAGVLLSMAQAEPGPDVAAPVPAVSPSIPGDPPPLMRPDTESPALQPGLSYVDDTIEGEGFEVALRVPRDWKRIPIGLGEVKWLVPDNRLNTFLLRIESVASQRQTIDAIKAQRIRDLDQITDDFQLVQETDTSMHFVYVDNGLTRYGNLRWINDPNPLIDQAIVEVAANGRERDQPGLVDLIARVGNGIEARL